MELSTLNLIEIHLPIYKKEFCQRTRLIDVVTAGKQREVEPIFRKKRLAPLL